MPLPSLTLCLYQFLFTIFCLGSHVRSIYDPEQVISLTSSVHPQYSLEFPSAVSFYVEASQGGYPLLGLDVVVLIERPKMVTQLPKFLRDDGRLADKTRRDGIYSGRFVDYTAEGRYAYKFLVFGKNNFCWSYFSCCSWCLSVLSVGQSGFFSV